jgi:hypothetical protein
MPISNWFAIFLIFRFLKDDIMLMTEKLSKYFIPKRFISTDEFKVFFSGIAKKLIIKKSQV